MKDRRPGPWVALPTRWATDFKYLSLSIAAREALLRLWLYSGDQRTGGIFPESTLRSLGIESSALDELRQDGWIIKQSASQLALQSARQNEVLVGFLDWNRSAEEIKNLSPKRILAGSLGGKKRFKQSASQESGIRNQDKIPTVSPPPIGVGQMAFVENQKLEKSEKPKKEKKIPALPFTPLRAWELVYEGGGDGAVMRPDKRVMGPGHYAKISEWIKKFPDENTWRNLGRVFAEQEWREDKVDPSALIAAKMGTYLYDACELNGVDHA